LGCVSVGRFKVPEGKTRLVAYVDEKLYKDIVRIAPNVYGKYRGAISHVVEEALRQWLQPLLHTQIHTRNPPDRVRAAYIKVMRKLCEILGLPDYVPSAIPNDIPHAYMERAIAQSLGHDPRTIRKYMYIFEKCGLFKHISAGLIHLVTKA